MKVALYPLRSNQESFHGEEANLHEWSGPL